MKKHLSKISFLVIGLSLAATASYLNAWSGPTSQIVNGIPNGNVDAPINIGPSNQVKQGNVEANALSAVGVVASQFCLGENCITAWPSGGSSVPAGTVAAFNLTTCPAGWIPSDGNNGTRDLRGYFIRGYGTNSDGTASAALGVKQADEFKNHDHSESLMSPQGVPAVRGTSLEFDWFGTNGGGTPFLAPKQTDGYWVIGDNNGPYGQVRPQGGIETRPKNVALLFCQKDGTSSGGGSSTSLVKYGGSYLVGAGGALNAYGMGACPTPNIVTGTCSCPSGYTARLTSQAAYYHFSAWDSTYSGYTCESL